MEARGKIEKSITKAVQEKKRGVGGVARGGGRGGKGETKGDEELQKAESCRALLINSIRGRPLSFLFFFFLPPPFFFWNFGVAY